MARARVMGPRITGYRGAAAFSPSDIATLVAWYDASDAATITSSGGLVSQWNDKTVSANNLTNGIGSAQPTTGSRTQNGLNVIDFDGTSDYMDIAGTIASQPFTCFAVYKLDSTAKMRAWDGLSGARSLYNASSGQYGIYSGTVVDVAASTTNVVCHQALFNGASSKVQIDGTSYTSINPGSAGLGQLTVARDGGGNFMDGYWCELCFATGDQSASFTNFRSYAQSKWATP